MNCKSLLKALENAENMRFYGNINVKICKMLKKALLFLP
jgi:hypothetical protein